MHSKVNHNENEKTTHRLEENVGRLLFDIYHNKIFYDPPPRVMEIKAKINKQDLIKLKSFVVESKVREPDSSSSIYLSQDCFDYSESFAFLYKF